MDPVTIIIENNQFQAAVVQELLRQTKLNVIGMHRDKDKLTAFMPLATRYEQGMIAHDPDLPEDFTNELLAFTGTKDDDHDDYVDASSNAYAGLPATRVQIASAGDRMRFQ
jgi:predicted phage terminase large subunit-like protein